MTEAFADRLVAATRRLGPLCVGVDPHAGLLPSLFGPPGPEAAARWGMALVARAAGKAAVVKPQAGLFERWGASGLMALQEVCTAAKEAGLMVILDAKRGDIGSTAEGYAEGYLGAESSCPCDAITVNPYMGIETIEPFTKIAERDGKGVVVLARTSNPGVGGFPAEADRRRAPVPSCRPRTGADDRPPARAEDGMVGADDRGRRNRTGGSGAPAKCGERRTVSRSRLWRAGRRRT